jgi:CheY-like chemotaxis protein
MWTPTDVSAGRLANYIASGEAIFFVGAGLSATSGAPLWSELTTELAAQLSPPPSTSDPLLIAQFFRNAFGDNELVNWIRRRLAPTTLRPSRCHELLANFPCRVYVTTNYDSLLETALHVRKKAVHTICNDDDLALWDENAEIQVMKLHGDLDRPRTLVISHEDYSRLLSGNFATGRKLADLFWHRPFVFVGYSMNDPDITAIYYGMVSSVGELKRPSFMITADSDPHMTDEWRRRGISVVRLDTSTTRAAEALESYLEGLARTVSGRRENGCDILVVEDDDPIATLLSRLIERTFPDKRVLRATEGLEASLIMGRYKPRVVLLDLMMPVMTGVDLLKLMARDRELSEVKVVIVSAYPGLIAEARNVVARFTKPMDIPEFLSSLASILSSA